MAVLGVPGQKSGVPGVPATFLADSNSFSHQNVKTCVWRLFRRPLEGFPEGFNTKLCLGRVPEGVREAVWASGTPGKPEKNRPISYPSEFGSERGGVFFRVCGKNPLCISAFDAFGLDIPRGKTAVSGVPGSGGRLGVQTGLQNGVEKGVKF